MSLLNMITLIIVPLNNTSYNRRRKVAKKRLKKKFLVMIYDIILWIYKVSALIEYYIRKLKNFF